MNILVTGGAGYIGTTLVPQLLSLGHDVRVYDCLKFGGNGLIPMFRKENFSFVKGDVRDSESLRPHVSWADVIVHLAAIVGYPACSKEPELAKQVNVDATRRLVSLVSPEQLVLFGSTGSNYGALADGICTEESPLQPLSLYGETKTEAERIIMSETSGVAYRFATAFGISPRLRLDLLVNDFVNKAINDKYIVVYESHFMRTFIHVHDIARSFIHAIENREGMVNNVYNVGADNMNRSKREICELIKDKVDYYLHLADYGKDADARNYIVSYDKIAESGFGTTVSIEKGVSELVNALQVVQLNDPYRNV
jgi:nucleoside-diphosphate-sugar epimerase